MADLVTGIAMFLIIEGLVYALAPRFIVRMAQLLPGIPEEHLRLSGLIAIIFGVGLVGFLRG